MKATSLNEFEDKTVIFWTLGTHGLDQLNRFPLLVLWGSTSSGKSTAAEILVRLANDALLLSAPLTKAVLRTTLGQYKTFILDEANDIPEDVVSNRYSRVNATTKVNEKTSWGWSGGTDKNLLGATMLCRRPPIADPSLQSRSIIIATRPAESGVEGWDETEVDSLKLPLQELATTIDWKLASQWNGKGRIKETWAPVLLVAQSIGDEEHFLAAMDRIAEDEAHFSVGQESEPIAALYSALLTLALEFDETNGEATVKERVSMPAIREQLEKDGMVFSSTQVGSILRQIGIEPRKVGGPMYAYTGGVDNLRHIGRKLGVKDEWLGQEKQEAILTR